MDSVSHRSPRMHRRERAAGVCPAAPGIPRRASAPPTSVPPSQLPLLRADLAQAPPGLLADPRGPATPGDAVGVAGPGREERRSFENALKIGRSATIAMLAQGSCFGSSFALGNYLRASGPPVVKVAAGLLPVAAAALTAPLEMRLRELLNEPGTRPKEPSLLHDAIPSAVLFAVNAGYIKSSALPKFPPTSGRAALATATLSFVGTFVAGAATEAAAQYSRRHDPDAAAPPPLPDRSETGRIAVGRALSFMPMAAYMQIPAAYFTHQNAVPPQLALFPIGVALTGWTFRRVLMPPLQTEQPSVQQPPRAQEPPQHPLQPASATAQQLPS